MRQGSGCMSFQTLSRFKNDHTISFIPPDGELQCEVCVRDQLDYLNDEIVFIRQGVPDCPTS